MNAYMASFQKVLEVRFRSPSFCPPSEGRRTVTQRENASVQYGKQSSHHHGLRFILAKRIRPNVAAFVCCICCCGTTLSAATFLLRTIRSPCSIHSWIYKNITPHRVLHIEKEFIVCSRTVTILFMRCLSKTLGGKIFCQINLNCATLSWPVCELNPMCSVSQIHLDGHSSGAAVAF